MKNIVYILTLSLLLFTESSCAFGQAKKTYSIYYEYGVVSFTSNDIIFNITEDKKHFQYKLVFDGKEIAKIKGADLPEEIYTQRKENWYYCLTNNIFYKDNPPSDYKLITTKSFNDIEVKQFDKIQNETCISKLEIKLKGKMSIIEIKNSNIFDLKVITIDKKNYLVVLQGTEGSGSFSSMIDIYQL
ncbi:MAG: hypothetical protein A2096_10095 [Spirochaetes bacterium GWF1_41_5]|nr:MAG: hypothetical protein A2096_10095 [Spirochaetes bacterium GWF1_41_5]HBE02524.1 hypothetical protein [Spirochaetia bacterium]